MYVFLYLIEVNVRFSVPNWVQSAVGAIHMTLFSSSLCCGSHAHSPLPKSCSWPSSQVHFAVVFMPMALFLGHSMVFIFLPTFVLLETSHLHHIPIVSQNVKFNAIKIEAAKNPNYVETAKKLLPKLLNCVIVALQINPTHWSTNSWHMMYKYGCIRSRRILLCSNWKFFEIAVNLTKRLSS